MTTAKLVFPDWPQPANVGACVTTRAGGVSVAPWDSFNLGNHVGDDPAAVETNRQRLIRYAALPASPVWLEQVHGTRVLRLPVDDPTDRQADAAWTNQPGVVCAVMTADCLPVLLCSRSGEEIAAVHAGWRGLCDGILERAVSQFRTPSAEIMAWLGPAIGPAAFEVGAEVRAAFVACDAQATDAFRPVDDKYYADLYLLARQRLARQGVQAVWGGQYCTFQDPQRFYSYRRDRITGRMATLIWRNF